MSNANSIDIHEVGYWAVIDHAKNPVEGSFHSTGYSARASVIRMKNLTWTKLYEKGYRLVKLEITAQVDER